MSVWTCCARSRVRLVGIVGIAESRSGSAALHVEVNVVQPHDLPFGQRNERADLVDALFARAARDGVVARVQNLPADLHGVEVK